MDRAAAKREFPEHFDGERFYNPDAPPPFGFAQVLRWKLTSRPEPSPRFVADVEPTVPPRRVERGQLRITLVNHSTVLIQLPGANILTDPIWSERTSPLSWIGPRRHRAPGVRIEDLPPLDAVLISHDHYDHLDLPTLRQLAPRHNPAFVVPARVSRTLRSANITSARELDWSDSLPLSNVVVHCVPAVHFSARRLFDRNLSLWCGYVIESQEGLVYFAGDTAFGSHFAGIRAKYGAPRVALLPIGSYLPRWFMSRVHMDPAGAVAAHELLGARTSIAIHHGTFQLADDGIDTAKKELLACRRDPSFLVLRNGESVNIP